MNDYKDTLIKLLESDLDFHDKDSGYSSHNFHSFPAKFPPQLPRKFIKGLTKSGDAVLDPMVGSGTTILEAFLNNRKGIGFDIDPLALNLANTKVTSLNTEKLIELKNIIIVNARNYLNDGRYEIEFGLLNHWEESTEKFVNYWFAEETQHELYVLLQEIKRVKEPKYRRFFELALSGVIITKSGGVSLAFDLAHTRPHRAKVAYTTQGDLIVGEEFKNSTDDRVKFLTKNLKSPLVEFENKVETNIQGLKKIASNKYMTKVMAGDAQQLPLKGASIDLIVTSPPYASNAIDYMRAHKFSLVWLGHEINDLGSLRKDYIGGEAITNFDFEELPHEVKLIVNKISSKDEKKGIVLHRYYSEMTRVLREIYRVLKPGKSAIVVVGNSIMRGISTETDNCLVEIGKVVGFEVPKVGVRTLDRNRRMLPAGKKINGNSQIQQRMHQEYVIGFYKPPNTQEG